LTGWDSPYKAIISVNGAKEGWDCGTYHHRLAYAPIRERQTSCPNRRSGVACANVSGDWEEYVSVVGPNALWNSWNHPFRWKVWSWNAKPMGEGRSPRTPLVVEIDNENTKKDMEGLDIEIPGPDRVSPGIQEPGTLDVERDAASTCRLPANSARATTEIVSRM